MSHVRLDEKARVHVVRDSGVMGVDVRAESEVARGDASGALHLNIIATVVVAISIVGAAIRISRIRRSRERGRYRLSKPGIRTLGTDSWVEINDK